MEGIMKYLILLSLIACTTAPSIQKLTHDKIKNKECLTPLENVKLTPGQTVMGLFQQTAGTAGNVVATSAGVVGDTIVVGTGLAGTFLLCAQDSIFCDDLLGSYVGLMEEADLLWNTKKAYKGSSSWRCPQVDHISRAFRKVSECLHDKGEYVAAFEQIGIVEDNDVLKNCSSGPEKEKMETLKAQLVYPGVAEKIRP